MLLDTAFLHKLLWLKSSFEITDNSSIVNQNTFKWPSEKHTHITMQIEFDNWFCCLLVFLKMCAHITVQHNSFHFCHLLECFMFSSSTCSSRTALRPWSPGQVYPSPLHQSILSSVILPPHPPSLSSTPLQTAQHMLEPLKPPQE